MSSERHPGMRARAHTVRASYDEQAARYAENSELQAGNLQRLLEHLTDPAGNLPDGTYLDVGCGTGVLARKIAQGARPGHRPYVGLDLSLEMLRYARRTVPPQLGFTQASATELPIGDACVDYVVSNSTLHWLNDDGELAPIRQAVAECYRVLRRGGRCLVSIAGCGTARTFLAAYLHIVRQLDRPSLCGPLRENPGGFVSLPDMVDCFLDAGFTLDHGSLLYEPVTYPSAEAYGEVVRAYGFRVFMDCVREAEREAVWSEVVREFARTVGARRYVHDQYMIYITAHRA